MITAIRSQPMVGGILTLQENAGIPLPLAHLELPPKIVMLVQTQTLLHLMKTVQDSVVPERYPKSPSPVQSAKEKRAKLSPTESKTSTRNSKLRAVFKNHFSDLLILITDPELLAAQLYSESLISSATLDEIMTLPISRLKKTLRLLLDLKRKIQVYPEKLFVFIHVMERDSSLEDIVKQMLGMSCYQSF